MQRFIQGHLPPSFNNVWFTNETRRTETVSMSLRNSDVSIIGINYFTAYCLLFTEFCFALFRFEAKITEVKRSEKFEAKRSEKKRKKRSEIL
jgi:hypothetical protein